MIESLIRHIVALRVCHDLVYFFYNLLVFNEATALIVGDVSADLQPSHSLELVEMVVMATLYWCVG